VFGKEELGGVQMAPAGPEGRPWKRSREEEVEEFPGVEDNLCEEKVSSPARERLRWVAQMVQDVHEAVKIICNYVLASLLQTKVLSVKHVSTSRRPSVIGVPQCPKLLVIAPKTSPGRIGMTSPS
jgi:hypothetical protein